MEERFRRTLRLEARNSRRRRLACLCTGVASLVLLLVAFVLQVVEGSWFPLLTTAAAFVLQVRLSDDGRFPSISGTGTYRLMELVVAPPLCTTYRLAPSLWTGPGFVCIGAARGENGIYGLTVYSLLLGG